MTFNGLDDFPDFGAGDERPYYNPFDWIGTYLEGRQYVDTSPDVPPAPWLVDEDVKLIDWIKRCGLTLESVVDDPEMIEDLRKHGCDGAKISEGVLLQHKTQEASLVRQGAIYDQDRDCGRLESAIQIARSSFDRFRLTGYVAFTNPKDWPELGLDRPVPSDRMEFIRFARQACCAALEESHAEGFRWTIYHHGSVTHLQQYITELAEAHSNYEPAVRKAFRTTAARDDLVSQLQDWMKAFFDTAREALQDKEKLFWLLES